VVVKGHAARVDATRRGLAVACRDHTARSSDIDDLSFSEGRPNKVVAQDLERAVDYRTTLAEVYARARRHGTGNNSGNN
jgi:hypothetical protein